MIADFFNKLHDELTAILSVADDATRSKAVDLHNAWREDAHYVIGDVCKHEGNLYKCLIEHDAQPTWTPEDSPSLWAKIMYREGIRVIEYPIPATDPFNYGDVGWWGDDLYRSILNANIYTPEQYPNGWEKLLK